VLLQENVPLAPLTTLGIGGPAQFYVRANSEREVSEAWHWSQEQGLDLQVLGGGSNVVIADGGLRGITLHLAVGGVRRSGAEIVVGAGEGWDAFVAWTVEQDLAGVECLSGIPGTVGGTPVQNVGAYGQEVAETISRVRALDRSSGEWVEMDAAECGFAYRTSRFNTHDRDRYIVTAVHFALRPGGAPTVRYPELRRALGAAPTLRETRVAVRRIRQCKAMLLVEGDPDARSAGSFFKNPIVSASAYAKLAQRLLSPPPQFPAETGMVKIPAAWLIEQTGLRKGFRPVWNGNPAPVAISSKHALALINCGGATAHDLMRLQQEIQQRVHQQFDIELQPEPVFLGFAS